MSTGNSVVVPEQNHTNVVKLKHWETVFGETKELVSRDLGAEQIGVIRVTLWGQDALHYHNRTEEVYICLEGSGEISLNGEISEFVPGVKVIIRPGTVHAARPAGYYPKNKIVFLCISSPAFSPEDVVNDPLGRRWVTKPELLPFTLDFIAADVSRALVEFKRGRTKGLILSEFKGSEEFEHTIGGIRLLTLLELAKEASEKELVDSMTKEQRDAYKLVRRNFFPEKLNYGDPGFEEWNVAIGKDFLNLLAGFRWDKVKDAKAKLQEFIDSPASASPEEIDHLIKFFNSLALSI